MTLDIAKISSLHCNFIINHEFATSNDIKELILKIQKKVFYKTRILLKKRSDFYFKNLMSHPTIFLIVMLPKSSNIISSFISLCLYA